MPDNTGVTLPPGMTYTEDFLSKTEEASLLDCVQSLAFEDIEMHGVVAKRRVVHYGLGYEYNARRTRPGDPIPDFILPVRAKIAKHLGMEPEEFVEVLVTEYTEGAGIGWHRDAPGFGKVVGLSLHSPCRFKMRPIAGAQGEPFELQVAPRSLYRLEGHARWRWEHSIPPAKELRYSLTFRTLRQGLGASWGT